MGRLLTLGSGGYATVYVCRLLGTSKYVAVKEVPKSKVFWNPQSVSSLWEERRALTNKKLRGNIMGCECILVDRFSIKFVLEWIEGATLWDHILRWRREAREVSSKEEETEKNSPSSNININIAALFTPFKSWYCIGQIVEAICYLHQNGIAYRDLKCPNVMVAGEGEGENKNRLKLVDFGFATERREVSEVLGTLRTMAPELVDLAGVRDDKPKPTIMIDPLPTDVFSVGCVAYEILHMGEALLKGCLEDVDLDRSNYERGLEGVKLEEDFVEADFILPLIARDPKLRPGIEEVRGRVKEILVSKKNENNENESTPHFPPLFATDIGFWMKDVIEGGEGGDRRNEGARATMGRVRGGLMMAGQEKEEDLIDVFEGFEWWA